MTEAQLLRRSIEKALAVANAAADEPTIYGILEAQSYADQLLPQLGSVRPASFSRAEARRVVALVWQLRAVLQALDRWLHPQPLALAS
ncbi:MAG: hypothetical protein JWN44_1481 [Myxococcales bacterium]|nr:hypothetical protein [Myxococcales bacterium]